MPKLAEDVWLFFQGMRREAPNAGIRAACEQLSGYVGSHGGDGGAGTDAEGKQRWGNTGASMFKLGFSCGGLQMACRAAGFSLVTVTANVWQHDLVIPPRLKRGRKLVEEKAAFKRRLRGEAQRLFPGVKITLATCDALLIAWWLRLRNRGKGE